MAWSFSMDTVLDLVGAKTRGKVTRAGEIEVQCPHGVCGRNKQPVYFSVNVAKGQYNCFHCCSGCPYSGGMIDLYCMFTGIDPNDRQFAKHAISMDLSGKPAHTKCKIVMRPESDIDLSLQARPDAELDKAYRAVLNELTLNPEHRENLRKRGLTDEVIDRCLYRSVPEHWAGVFVRLKKLKISFIGIPGFYEKNGKAFSACTKPGFFIPYFNADNQIVGMQIRFDDGDKRYRWFSSPGYENGCSAKNIASYGIPGVMPKCAKDKTVYITEGALKAHIACTLSGNSNPYIALAGVNCFNQWEATCEHLKALGVTHVADAFDSDRESNEHVRNALKKLYAIAARYGITMTRFNWGTAYKGVDDYFLAVSQGKALRPFIPANQSIVKCAEKQEFKYIPFIPRDLNVTA